MFCNKIKQKVYSAFSNIRLDKWRLLLGQITVIVNNYCNLTRHKVRNKKNKHKRN